MNDKMSYYSGESKGVTSLAMNDQQRFQQKAEYWKKAFSDLTRVDPSWWTLFEKEFEQSYCSELSTFVANERAQSDFNPDQYAVYPQYDDVFSWTMCSPQDVKVVIIGQDPYPQPGLAHGLCFSVRKPAPGCQFYLPWSLRNIFKELERDPKTPFTRPAHGDLTGWANQGVLLLNTVLTVRRGVPASHADQGWEEFTEAVIKHVSEERPKTVFMLWGNYAKDLQWTSLKHYKKANILTAFHPSRKEFDGCNAFSNCNKRLADQGLDPVVWNNL